MDLPQHEKMATGMVQSRSASLPHPGGQVSTFAPASKSEPRCSGSLLKKRMTRQESVALRSKMDVPRVPSENVEMVMLADIQSVPESIYRLLTRHIGLACDCSLKMVPGTHA